MSKTLGHVRVDRVGTRVVFSLRNRLWAKILAGFVFSLFFLWLAVRQVDGQRLRDALISIKYIPLLFCSAALSLGMVLRAVRWRVISCSPNEEQKNFARATDLGILTNLLFPGRAGEFVRVITLANLTRSSLSAPVASALIDRLVDVFVLLASASILYLFFPVSAVLGNWLIVFFIIALLLTLFVLLFARSSGFFKALVAILIKLLLRSWRLQPEVFMSELRIEFRRLLVGWPSADMALLAALILCADYGAVTAILHAFNLSLAIEAPLLLWVFLAAGSALPSAPGYVGVYQLAAVWALSFYAVSATTAVAVATVLQVMTLAVALFRAGPSALIILWHMLTAKDKT